MAFTARIPLTSGKHTLVDVADLEWLSQWKWHTHLSGEVFYAGRFQWDGQKNWHISMARLILGLTDSSLYADHKNGDTLDNRRSNLRVATYVQSLANRRRYKNNVTGFKGVGWDCQRKKYRARLKHGGKTVHSSFHDTPEQAFDAYKHAAVSLHGEFVRTE